MHQDLAKLDKAITVLERLFGTDTTSPDGHAGKRTLSAADRRKIGKAQKLRWAKLKQQAGKK
jgi:lysozyme family protein